MRKIVTIIVSLAFILGQLGRIQVNNAVAVTVLDIVVTGVLFVWGSTHIPWIRQRGRSIVKKYRILFLFPLVAAVSLLVRILDLPLQDLLPPALYFLRFIVYTALFFVVLSQDAEIKKYIQKTMIGTGSVIVLLGYIQFFFYPNLRNLYYLGWDEHLYRLFSTFLDPNFAGAFFALFFIFLCGYILQTKKNENTKSLLIFLILAVCTGIALFLTQSRSALFMLFFGAGIFFIFVGKKKLILLLVGILLFFFLLSSRFFYLENINPFRIASSMARITTAQNALTVIKDHPVLGVGFNTYALTQRVYGFTVGSNPYPSHSEGGTDNSLLFVTATTGIMGLFVYIGVWVFLIRRSLQRYKTKKSYMGLVFVCSAIGLVVDSLFINSLFYVQIILWMSVIYGVTESTSS